MLESLGKKCRDWDPCGHDLSKRRIRGHGKNDSEANEPIAENSLEENGGEPRDAVGGIQIRLGLGSRGNLRCNPAGCVCAALRQDKVKKHSIGNAAQEVCDKDKPEVARDPASASAYLQRTKRNDGKAACDEFKPQEDYHDETHGEYDGPDEGHVCLERSREGKARRAGQ